MAVIHEWRGILFFSLAILACMLKGRWMEPRFARLVVCGSCVF